MLCICHENWKTHSGFSSVWSHSITKTFCLRHLRAPLKFWRIHQEETVFTRQMCNSSHQSCFYCMVLGLFFYFLYLFVCACMCVSCSFPVAWSHMKGGHKKFSILCWVRSKDPLSIWKELQRKKTKWTTEVETQISRQSQGFGMMLKIGRLVQKGLWKVS